MYGRRERQQWASKPQEHRPMRDADYPEPGRRGRGDDWEVPKGGYYYEHDDRERDAGPPRRGGNWQGGEFQQRPGFREPHFARERRDYPREPREWDEGRRTRQQADRGRSGASWQGEAGGEGQYSPTRHSEPAGRPQWPARGDGMERYPRERERSPPPPFHRQQRGRGRGRGYGRPYYDEHDTRDADGGPAWGGRGTARKRSPEGKWKHDMFEKVAAEEEPGQQEEQKAQQDNKAGPEEAMPDQVEESEHSEGAE